ncbi:MAG: hypothetical protein ACE5I1_32460 [bacterium]
MNADIYAHAIWYHVVTVVSLVTFKIVVVFVGYLIGKLGYELLIKGVSGEFKFHTEFKGSKADLVSASPGIFFILMATILIAIGILKDKPFETVISERIIRSAAEQQQTEQTKKGEIQLPEEPPVEGQNEK